MRSPQAIAAGWGVLFALGSAWSVAAGDGTAVDFQRDVQALSARLIDWRRDIHQHPELGNREFRTAELVANHLNSLAIDVRTKVAHTGVVGVLRGSRPGPVIALRADMDALPVVEQVDLPFKSTVRAQYNGQEVGVMHACGHDTHVAILMAVAEILAKHRDDLPGVVKFIFQPAEEGSPVGEQGGADLMLAEGAFSDPKPEAVFGLHVMPLPLATLGYRSGGLMAASDSFTIKVLGRQTHGALPWDGVDPVVVAAQIVMGLQTIVSRQVDATVTPSVISVGKINGGVRYNIIPSTVEMLGTIRTFDAKVRDQLHERLKRTAEQIAASAGAQAIVTITRGNPVTFNDPALMQRVLPSLQRVPGATVREVNPQTTAEDFSQYQAVVPGVFFFLGGAPEDPALIFPNHSDRFFVDERALPIGVEALLQVAWDYLHQPK